MGAERGKGGGIECDAMTLVVALTASNHLEAARMRRAREPERDCAAGASRDASPGKVPATLDAKFPFREQRAKRCDRPLGDLARIAECSAAALCRTG